LCRQSLGIVLGNRRFDHIQGGGLDLDAEFPAHGPGFPVKVEIAGLMGPDTQAAAGQGAHVAAVVQGAVEQAGDEDGCV